MEKKEYSSWGGYFKEKGKDIKNNLYYFVDTVNKLGVKAPVTDYKKLNENIPVDDEDLEEDQTKEYIHHQKNKNIRHIRKARDINKGLALDSTLINSFQLNDEDKNFLETELNLLSGSKVRMQYIHTYYRGIFSTLLAMNRKLTNENEDFLTDIPYDIILLTRCFAVTKLLLNHAYFLIENQKGLLGFPSSYGIAIMNANYFNYIEYTINNIPKIAKALDIALNIINQYQKHYPVLLKDYISHDKMNNNHKAIYQPQEVFTKVLSLLNALTNNRSQDLDRFIDKFFIGNDKVKYNKLLLFWKRFNDKESAKACVEKMNKNLLSKKFPNFDLYKYVDSLDGNIQDLIKDYTIMHNNLIGNERVDADTRINDHSFFNHYRIIDREKFNRPFLLENVQCVTSKHANENNKITTPTIATTKSTEDKNNNIEIIYLDTIPGTEEQNQNTNTSKALETTPRTENATINKDFETTSITRNTTNSTALTPTPSTGNRTNSTALTPTPNTGNTTNNTSLTPTPNTGNRTNSTALTPTPSTWNTPNTTSTLNGAQIGGIITGGLLIATFLGVGKYLWDKYFSNNQRTIEDELRNMIIYTEDDHGNGVSKVDGSIPLLSTGSLDKNNFSTQGSRRFGRERETQL